MKQYYKYALRYATVVVMMLSALTFTACGGDDDEGDGNQSGQVDKKNKNANILSAANGYNKAIRRTEFPALKKTGKQKVIVYRMTSTSYDKDGVNFSVEWDCDKRSQRWTCYQMHKGYSGKYSRESNFFFDQTNLNSNEYWGEYTRFPGYDRGHICPSGIVPPLQTKIVSVAESLSAHLRSWFSPRTHRENLPQNTQTPQSLQLRKSPTEFTEPTEPSAENNLPQNSRNTQNFLLR